MPVKNAKEEIEQEEIEEEEGHPAHCQHQYQCYNRSGWYQRQCGASGGVGRGWSSRAGWYHRARATADHVQTRGSVPRMRTGVIYSGEVTRRGRSSGRRDRRATSALGSARCSVQRAPPRAACSDYAGTIHGCPTANRRSPMRIPTRDWKGPAGTLTFAYYGSASLSMEMHHVASSHHDRNEHRLLDGGIQ